MSQVLQDQGTLTKHLLFQEVTDDTALFPPVPSTLSHQLVPA